MEVMAAHYLYRERWYGNVASGGQTLDPQLALYRAMAFVNMDRIPDALSLLEPLLNQLSAITAALTAMIFAHNKCQVIDREAIEKLEKRLNEEQSRKGLADPWLEALFHYLSGNPEKAQSQIEALLQSNPTASRAFTLLGWIQLDQKKTRTALRSFNQAIQLDKENADALMGEVKSLGTSEALGRVSSLIVKYPKCVIPLLEKMKLQLSEKKWQETLDTAIRAMGLQSYNLLALELTALKHVVEGNYDESVPLIKKLHVEIENQEPKAWWLYLEVLSLISRCCGRDVEVLAALDGYAENALRWGGAKASVHSEISRLCLLQGHVREAETAAAEACKLEPTVALHLARLTAAHYAIAGLTSQVREEILFLAEVAGRDTKEPELCFLMSKIWVDESIELLDRAVSTLQAKASLHKFGVNYLIKLDPDLLIRIAGAYPDTRVGDKRRARVLSLVSEVCPGLVDARLSLVRAQLNLGNLQDANSALEGIDHPSAALLAAQIYLQQGEIEKAANKLELGLSENLSLREFPGFHVITGLIEVARNNDLSAIGSLKLALQSNKGTHKLTDKELGLVYAELSSAYMRQNELKNAEVALKEANELLKNTDQEVKLKMERAHLLALQGDPRKAIAELSEITVDHPYYVQCEMKKAQIYLDFMKDDRGFADCYRRLVNADPSPDNLILLGDAYLAVQEPDLAVQSYEKAMEANPGSSKLSCKLAGVLVKCHLYNKAIKAYQNAGDEGSLELGELFLSLGQLEKAENAVADLPKAQKAFLIAKIHEKKGDTDGALKTLEDVQGEIIRGDSKTGSKLLYQMGMLASNLRDYSTGIDYLKKSLNYNPDNIQTQVALAKLYMQIKDWSSCKTLCSSILAKDPGNEATLLMIADLALRQLDLPTSAFHLTALLQGKPTSWLALARLIQVNRRAANLEQSLPYIEAARSNAPNHPALHYCTGIYYLYSGDLQKGIEELNMARGDAEWGRQAVHDMVEACLAIGETQAAQKLLDDIIPTGPEEEGRLLLLNSFVKLASDKMDLDKAMADLNHLANAETYRVGATLGLGLGLVAQKQINRAKVVLKQVARTPWSMEEAEYLERLWLLLAELYVTNSSADLAGDLLNRVISHNQSSAKAYELLGLLSEKEQKYNEASQNYKKAWELSGAADAALGYKLAYNMLKNKRYAETVSVCQKVLSSNPEYPKIRKEILEKALKKLRT